MTRYTKAAIRLARSCGHDLDSDDRVRQEFNEDAYAEFLAASHAARPLNLARFLRWLKGLRADPRYYGAGKAGW